MSAITAKASRKMKKYAVLTREPRCFLGSFDFSWEQRKFSDVVATRRGLTYKPSDIRKNGVRVLRSSNIAEDSFVLSDEDVFVVREAVNIDCVRANDILITAANGSSRLVGKHTIISGIPEESAVHGGFMLLGTTKEPHFVNASMGSSWYRRFIELFVAGGNGAIGNLNKNDLDNQDIAIPSEKEQKKIGSFFRQLDNLITLHQRKCALLFSPFQAFISMMFTTSTFSWEQRKLGDVGETYTGLSGKTKADFGHGQARFVTYMNVFSNPISNPEMTEPIEIDPKQNEVEVGDVFFTTSSETPEEVGMSSVLLEKRGKIYLNSFCFGFRPTEKIDSYYLAYMLRSESAREKIILLAQGISRYNISKNKVMEIAVSLPSLDEQKLIGQYFRQLDNLITLHQRKPFLMKWRTSDANRNQTNRLVL